MEGAMMSTAELIFELVADPFTKTVKSMWNNEEEIKNLADAINLIRDVLSEVQGKQFKEACVINGYERLRKAFLDAEDFLDRVHTLKKKKELKARMVEEGKEEIVNKGSGELKQPLAFGDIKLKSYKTKARRFFSILHQDKYALEVNNKIKKINKNLNAILEHMQKLGPEVPTRSSEATQMTARASGSNVATRIFGRDDDNRKIVDLLLRSSDEQKKIPVISIVAPGGLGKTTVAQLVYNDESWQESCQFDERMWVSDSKNLDFKSLLKHILNTICLRETHLDELELELELEEDGLRQQIVDKICGKRFFLVLDDVENEDPFDWENLKGLLDCGTKESRILVTTRSRKVANVVSSLDSTHVLTGLSKKDSLELFESYAFRGKRDESLVVIANLIVEKCYGVPLAIKVVGCLLYGEGKRKWEYVRHNSLTDIEDEGSQIMHILKMSYDVLDSTLKQCFSLCALFPKNYGISREILRKIWMANVSLKIAEFETLDDACDENLRILYNRCFLEAKKAKKDSDDAHPIMQDEWDDVAYFKMHDLMHDLAKEVAGAEILVVDANNLIIEEDVRHVSLKYNASTFEPKGRGLRTFIQSGYATELHAEKIVLYGPFLRYLDMGWLEIKNLTNSIGNLIHLRYLCLSYNEFQSLPHSITELINLNSLELASCTNLTHLPSGMGALTSLEVLDISGCWKLQKLPRGIEKLMKLKKLLLAFCWDLVGMPSGMGALLGICEPARFIVGNSTESNHNAQLEELGPLLDLPAKLRIDLPAKMTLKKGYDGDEAFLFNKNSLRQLEICWQKCGFSIEDEVPANHMEMLGKLQPPTSLEEFNLSGYQGMVFPSWMPKDGFSSVLPNLVYLCMEDCRGCQYLPPLSRLHCLRYLGLKFLQSLEYIEEDKYDSDAPFCLQQLESLELSHLLELKGWRRGHFATTNQSWVLPSFPRLSSVNIANCPNLMAPTLLSVLTALDTEKDLSSSSFHLFAQVCKNNGGFGVSKGDQNSLTLKFDGLFSPSIYMAKAFIGMSHHLTRLDFKFCPGLKTVPGLQHLIALRELWISWCDSFTWEEDEEEGKLQSVEEVVELSWKALTLSWKDSTCLPPTSPPPLSWKALTTLQKLRLESLPKLARLPERIQYLTSLQEIEIRDCNNLLIPEWLRRTYECKTYSCSSNWFYWWKKEIISAQEKDHSSVMHHLDVDATRLENQEWLHRTYESKTYSSSSSNRFYWGEKEIIPAQEKDHSSVMHHLEVDATRLENQGAISNEEPLRKHVLEFEKELEARRLLFLFEKGNEFEQEMLIQLWMALGILTDEPMELIGASYFEKLVDEGYISYSGAKSIYKVSAEKMKTDLDMIRDKKYYVIVDNGSRSDVASTETLHVSIMCNEIDESVIRTLGRCKWLKILLFLRNYGPRLQEVPRDLLLCYESIVALDLSGAHIKELPSSAEKMIHLRFLDLSWTFIEFLPERIDHFKMLQTLKLKGCSHLHKLPKE